MRLILKPAGIACVIIAFALLAFLALRNQSKTPAKTAATKVEAPALPKATTPEPAASAAPRKPGFLLEPNIVSGPWQSLITTGKPKVNIEVVKATVPGHPMARRITIEEIGTNPWDIQIAHDLDCRFEAGKRIRLAFWGRSKGSHKVNVAVEQAGDPYEKLLFKEFTFTDKWQSYTAEWDQMTDRPSGWARVDFQVGAQKGQVEITGVVLSVAGNIRP